MRPIIPSSNSIRRNVVPFGGMVLLAVLSLLAASLPADGSSPRWSPPDDLLGGSPVTYKDSESGVRATFAPTSTPAAIVVEVSPDQPREPVGDGQVRQVPGSAVIRITAVGEGGRRVTSFPHQVELSEWSEDSPGIVESFTPGIVVEMPVSATQVDELDPASLEVWTRSEGETEWSVLPSAYDPVSGLVRAHTDHLSDFVVMGHDASGGDGPSIVLDPDDNVGFANWPDDGYQSEITYNVRLAEEAVPLLEEACNADVLVTRDSTPFVDRELRAQRTARCQCRAGPDRHHGLQRAHGLSLRG